MPSDAEINALIERLTEAANLRPPLLASPMLEKAAHFLAALRDERDRMDRSAFQADEDERYCIDVSEALGIEQKENAMLEARVRELEQKLERARGALEPFAREGSKLTPDLDKYSWLNTGLSNANFRHARAALAEIGQRG